jgi:hypothetical protein
MSYEEYILMSMACLIKQVTSEILEHLLHVTLISYATVIVRSIELAAPRFLLSFTIIITHIDLLGFWAAIDRT